MKTENANATPCLLRLTALFLLEKEEIFFFYKMFKQLFCVNWIKSPEEKDHPGLKSRFFPITRHLQILFSYEISEQSHTGSQIP